MYGQEYSHHVSDLYYKHEFNPFFPETIFSTKFCDVT